MELIPDYELPDEVLDGEKKEFLRGTFSMMDIDENSQEELDRLKEKFLNCKKELGGLQVKEFEAALRPFISKDVSDAHIRTIFRKMDTRDQEAVSWEEFINFAITEHTMRARMIETEDEKPFGSEVRNIKNRHKDQIVSISFMPNINANLGTFDWNYGKYMVLSREGLMSIWSTSFKNLSYNNLVVGTNKNSCWFLDMVSVYHSGYVALISTNRDLCLYDYTKRGWMRKYYIRGLDHCACTMSYWAGLKSDQAMIILGDTSGSVMLLEFDLSNLNPLFGLAVREGCYTLYWNDILRGACHGTTARVFSQVHRDWVKQVQYVPEINSVLSCCIDEDTAMYMTYVDPKKRPPTYFNTIKGILCFDYSHALHVMACAGTECSIMLFNPYVPKKIVTAKEAHIRPVVKIRINEVEKYSISADMTKTIIIFSLINQSILQRIPGQSVHLGQYPISTLYLHSIRRVCLIGAVNLAIIRRHSLEDAVNVDVRSHDFKIVGALYSPEFEQVVSVCRNGMVRVWDLNTGTRVMQFDRAHKKKVQGKWVPLEVECIALSENKRRLFTAAEGTIKIWNFNTGSVLRIIDLSESNKITGIVMAKKQIYVTGWHKVINVFSDFKGEEAVKRTWATIHLSDCLNLCIMEPNMIASCSYDGTIVVWSRESTYDYCKLHATFGPKPELSTGVRSGGNKQNIMHVAADLEAHSDEEMVEGEDHFMTIGIHLNKEKGWYKLLRALKRKQIEREKRRAARERKDFTARYKKKKKRMNMQGLSLIYESAVEVMVFLPNRRLIDPHTATLVVSGAECWIRFWSIHPRGGLLGQFNATRRKLECIRCLVTDKNNEYLFTGDTLGFIRVFDILEFCNMDKLTIEEKEARERRLRQDFAYIGLPFKAEEMLDTMEKLRERKISVPDASKPRKNLKAPRLLSSIRAHTMAITSLEFIDDRNVIISASQDLTVRVWTKGCTYIGTFGETWRHLPRVIKRTVEEDPRIPRDVLRVASAHSLATLHDGRMPHWRLACYLVRRHIKELHKEKQIEETQRKMKEEKRARGEPDSDDEVTAGGEKPVSKILGKYYKPKKYYKGPITIKDQGYAPLRMFRSKCSPYSTTVLRDITCMQPLHDPEVFFEIDRRRTGSLKMRRSTRVMMNTLNTICCNPVRYHGKGGAASAASCMSVSSRRSNSRPSEFSNRAPSSHAGNTNANKFSVTSKEASSAKSRYGDRGNIQRSLRFLPATPAGGPGEAADSASSPSTSSRINAGSHNLSKKTGKLPEMGRTRMPVVGDQTARGSCFKVGRNTNDNLAYGVGDVDAYSPRDKNPQLYRWGTESSSMATGDSDVFSDFHLPTMGYETDREWKKMNKLTPAEYFKYKTYETSDSESDVSSDDGIDAYRYNMGIDPRTGTSSSHYDGADMMERIQKETSKYPSLPFLNPEENPDPGSPGKKKVQFSHLLG